MSQRPSRFSSTPVQRVSFQQPGLPCHSMLIIVPVFLLFLPVARSFVQGFMTGAVKE